MPDVTVVVPTRDRAAVCHQTLRAVLAQRDVDVEVIVIDEGSSDETPTMLAELGDDRVRVLRHDSPRGLPAARNVGLSLASAPWIAWCDDDDLWAPDKLRAQLDAVTSSGAEWSVCGSLRVDAELEPIGHQAAPHGNVLAQLLEANVVPGGGSGVLASTAVVRELGGFDESLTSSEDWEMWIRLARRGEPAAVDRPLVLYRIWPGSMSAKVDRMRSTRAEVLRRHGGTAAGDYDHERWLAKQLVRGGDRAAAAVAFARLAVRHRRPAELVRAVGALVAPRRLAATGDARARASVPASWIAEVASW